MNNNVVKSLLTVICLMRYAYVELLSFMGNIYGVLAFVRDFARVEEELFGLILKSL